MEWNWQTEQKERTVPFCLWRWQHSKPQSNRLTTCHLMSQSLTSCPYSVLGQAPNVEIVDSYRLRIHLEGLLRQLGVIAVGQVNSFRAEREGTLKLRLWGWEVLRDWIYWNLFTVHFWHDRSLIWGFMQQCFFSTARMALVQKNNRRLTSHFYATSKLVVPTMNYNQLPSCQTITHRICYGRNWHSESPCDGQTQKCGGSTTQSSLFPPQIEKHIDSLTSSY